MMTTSCDDEDVRRRMMRRSICYEVTVWVWDVFTAVSGHVGVGDPPWSTSMEFFFSYAVTLLGHTLASRSAKPTRGMVARSSALSSASCARFRSAVERMTAASSSSPIAALAASSRDRSLAAHSSASDASGTCSQPEA